MSTAARISARAPAAEPWAVRDQHLYFIGIGGCGVSGLARILAQRGAACTGSDSTPTHVTDALARSGIDVGFDQSTQWLPDDCDQVIHSAAIRPDHPQILEAERRGLPVLTYAEALGRCMLGRTAVALAGTHGKSTTTAMLGSALVDAGLDPTVIVGAICGTLANGNMGERGAPIGCRLGADEIPTGSMSGAPGLLVAESCEFNRSFHNHRPTLASISAVEADHLDIFGTLDAVVAAFADFAKLVPPADQGGRLLIAHDGAHRRTITAGVRCKVETIGFSPEADWVVTYDPSTRAITLARHRSPVGAWVSPLPGVHNAMNSATACTLAVMLGADPAITAQSLGAFGGLDRRSQLLGERPVESGGGVGGGGVVRVWDDYGHHPTEIDSTLRALREFEEPERHGGRLICVFQPHQHSRTRFLLEEFACAFEHADVVIVPQIYFVRDSEVEMHKVSSADLVDKLRKRNVRAMHLYPFEAIVEQLETLCRPNDVVVTMGAGPVWQVGRGFMDAAKKNGGGS